MSNGHRDGGYWGNYGGYESRQYDRTYDPRDQKYTNADFLESSDVIRLRDPSLREPRAAEEAPATAVHFWPSVGKFIIPSENTWAAHAELVQDERNSLFFNPEKYLFFDKIIAEKFPEILDAKNEGLRQNLAVMRNDIIGIYLNDGSFDPGDEKYVPLIQGIAETLGDALANDKWYKRAITRSFSTELANVEGVGAQEMYKFLLNAQMKPGYFTTLKSNVGELLDFPENNWGLPPLENTPYSDEGLSAPPPGKKPHGMGTDGAAANGANLSDKPPHEQMLAASDKLNVTVHKMRSVADMEAPSRAESVEEARKILRWLRNLQFADRDLEEWLGQGSHAQQIAKAESLQKLTHIYSVQLADAKRRNPDIEADDAVSDASASASAFAYAISAQTLDMLPDAHPGSGRLEAILDALAEETGPYQSRSVERLLDSMERGLEHLSGRPMGKTTGEKLVELNTRIQSNARRLRSVESLDEPVREESVELAREILRRLRNMQFSDKPVIEAIDAGRPEDKLAMAEKMEEIVDIYKNLLAEAITALPALANDPAIKEATEAAGAFSHAVKLMAAKEMPGSVAAAQQIGAEAARDPEEWKKLHGHTVDRLIKSMEGGVEKAVAAIAEQQEQQQQQDDLAQEAAQDAAAQQGSEGGKRKKRRKRQRGSGLTKSAKRRSAGDLNGDGVADKLQGINIGPNSVTIKAEDLAAIKSLGGKLGDIGKQLKDINANLKGKGGLTNVASTDTIIPDDKTAAQRAIEAELQKRSGKGGKPQIG